MADTLRIKLFRYTYTHKNGATILVLSLFVSLLGFTISQNSFFQGFPVITAWGLLIPVLTSPFLK